MKKKWGLGLAAGMTAMALAAPAMALDVTPYGAIRVGTWWTQNEYYSTTTKAKQSDNDFSLDLQGDSLFGIRAKEGDFSAVAELGAYNPKAMSSGIELRLLFGEWDFGGGKVRVGKAPSPYVYRTQQVFDADGGMNGYGSLWDGRYAQIKLTMNNGLYFTAMQPRVGAQANTTSNNAGQFANSPYNQTGNSYAATYTNYKTVMPKLVVGYEGKVSKLAYGGGVAYNFYKLDRVTASPAEADIHSYLVYFHGKLDLAPVVISYNLFGGRNTGDLMSTATSTGAYFDTTALRNSYTYGGWAEVGYKINPKMSVYTGVSYVNDDSKAGLADERLCAFANMQYQVSKNFKIVPEVSYMNDMYSKTGTKEPRTLAVGAKWEMVF